MKKTIFSLGLLFFLTTSAVSVLSRAEEILPDGPIQAMTSSSAELTENLPFIPAILSVSVEETVYSYEGMTVYNNGGTVYNHLGTVFNNNGVVYNSGGTVFNNGGTVYANSGFVFLNGGTVYRNEAQVYTSGREDDSDLGRILGYYELKLAEYYEPFVILDGITTEPGSEKMIISEDTVCHIIPKDGYQIIKAETQSGEFIWEED